MRRSQQNPRIRSGCLCRANASWCCALANWSVLLLLNLNENLSFHKENMFGIAATSFPCTQKRRLILRGASRVHKVTVLEMEGRLWDDRRDVCSTAHGPGTAQVELGHIKTREWLQGRKIRKGTRVSENQSITNLSLKCDWNLPCHMLERPAQLIWL